MLFFPLPLLCYPLAGGQRKWLGGKRRWLSGLVIVDLTTLCRWWRWAWRWNVWWSFFNRWSGGQTWGLNIYILWLWMKLQIVYVSLCNYTYRWHTVSILCRSMSIHGLLTYENEKITYGYNGRIKIIIISFCVCIMSKANTNTTFFIIIVYYIFVSWRHYICANHYAVFTTLQCC